MNSENQLNNNIVITDTSCLILLDKIGAFEILCNLYRNVITTPEIAKEYGDLPNWITVQNANQSIKYQYLLHVDDGEASALALATEIDCDYVILDDMEARKFAVKLGLPVKGTVGLLLSAKLSGVIPLFKPYLDLIQQTNFRLSKQLCERFLKDAGE